nr:reverse transcriptase domain-containing protein [Tanacetum cinerariifolium]
MMEELCQPSINGRGGPIALIPIQAIDFGLRHHMIQQVQNTCQFHGLPGDDANRHIDKFLEITQHMKQNEVSDDSLRLFLFPYSLTHHAISWYDRLPRNSIHSFDDMMRKFLSKYFPSSMKSFDLATTQMNENGSAVILKKLPEKLGDPANVYVEELNLRVDDEAITFKVGQTLKYSYNDAESINRIDVIDVACEEYVHEVLGFSDNSKSGNPTLILDPIIALSSSSLTPFEGGDFILEEIEACLTSESIPPGIDDIDLDLEGDIHLLEELLNNDPSLSPLPSKELNVEEIKTVKSSIDEPLELELKDLPSHLEYAYLEGTDKLYLIIAKGLKDDEKEALLKVLKSHKRAIA